MYILRWVIHSGVAGEGGVDVGTKPSMRAAVEIQQSARAGHAQKTPPSAPNVLQPRRGGRHPFVLANHGARWAGLCEAGVEC